MRKSKGQILIIAIVFIAVILIIAASLFSRVANFLSFGSKAIMREQATHLADAGVEYAIWNLNQNSAFTGTYSNVVVGTTGVFTVTVEGTGSIKTVTSTGYVPNLSAPKAKRTVKAQLVISGERISFVYATQVGTGGLTMANSSTIVGSVFSNGSIIGTGPSSIEGDAWAVGTVGSPPSVSGEIRDSIHPPQPSPWVMPAINYDTWIQTATQRGTPRTCPCNINGGISDIGIENWSRFNGDLSITNNAQVSMKGPVYVTGNFTISTGAKITLDDSFGSDGTVLLVDGTISVENNGYFAPTTADPKGYILVVTRSTAANAITIGNLGATAIFYALDGTAILRNQANVTALIGKTVHMQNQATLIYDRGLQGTGFTTGPGGAWVVKKGTYKFISSP